MSVCMRERDGLRDKHKRQCVTAMSMGQCIAKDEQMMKTKATDDRR